MVLYSKSFYYYITDSIILKHGIVLGSWNWYAWHNYLN